ncbi:MAG: sigma 54-interacting transcriptional regulator [Gudongella sp.]|nr:sigma 54-interacting transcriptional regulator [Gudongella sp.]
MLINSDEVERLVGKMDLGLIYIDDQYKIRMFNEKAKEIVGIKLNNIGSHSAGKLAQGDIVIIADNHVGGDDGDLTYLDLERINIMDDNIKQGDILLAVGVYNNYDIKPVYKYIRDNQLKDAFSLENHYLGNDIRACIDRGNKRIEIEVNSKKFSLQYFQTIGHIVIIDGLTGDIKFFQEKGYSIRKEEVATLLRGSSFLGKDDKSPSPSVKDFDFMQMFEDSEITKNLASYFKKESDILSNGLYYLNKRLVYCSFYVHSENAKKKGVYLVIKDGSELEDYLIDRNEILEQIEKKLRYGEVLHKEVPPDTFNLFAGNTPETTEVKYLAYKASQTKFNVILTGENGTGKSLLAREIHNSSKRADAPYVEVNCNSIAKSLFESELFGYVGGAFTGANPAGKMGYFEAANGGTIFLDEIGDLPLEIQVKLLYVFQNKTIYRVGSSNPIDIDFRMIVATNLDLEKEVEEGRFRQDLYYRINVFPIEIPPLRERKGDLYILINKLLKKFCLKYDVELKQFSGEALSKIMRYDWPGNVRELENILERAITLCSTNIIYPEHIKIKETRSNNTFKEMLAAEEKRIIKTCLTRNNNDKSKAIKELDISRSAFYEKINKYGIK